ncbi:MAG: HEAT repeat domain-containing protein [Candidatus Wallbacteria bacterium]
MNKESMLKIIKDQSLARKKKLADALSEIATDEAIDGIYQLLSDKSEFVVLFALEALNRLACEGFDINIKYAVDAYHAFGDKDSIKMACAKLLGNSSNSIAIKTLVEMLKDMTPGVRHYAVESLTKFGLSPTLALVNLFTEEYVEWPTREAAALALTFLSTLKGSEVEVTLKNVLTVKSENVQFSVVRSLKEIGNPVLANKIREFLKIETLEDRYEIRKMIKSISKKEEMEQLIKQLTLINQQICLDLVMALKSSKKYDESQDPITKIIKNCDDKRAKAIIIRIVGISRAKYALNIIAESVKDPDKRVRANAVESLAELGDENVIEVIKPALNDFDNRVKANAAKGLWKLGGARSLQILREMISDKDKWMRASAAYALGEIGVIQVVEILQLAVNDSDNDVRVNVIKSLGKIADRTSIETISEVMKNKSEDWGVRKCAIITLAKCLNEDACEVLMLEKENKQETDLYRETIKVVLEEIEQTNAELLKSVERKIVETRQAEADKKSLQALNDEDGSQTGHGDESNA